MLTTALIALNHLDEKVTISLSLNCNNLSELCLFQITHDALNAPLHILRAMYELQMKRTDSFFLEVQKR